MEDQTLAGSIMEIERKAHGQFPQLNKSKHFFFPFCISPDLKIEAPQKPKSLRQRVMRGGQAHLGNWWRECVSCVLAPERELHAGM